VNAPRVKVIALIARLTELLQQRLEAEIGCGKIQGSIFAILRSIVARAQLLHCDMEYNENTPITSNPGPDKQLITSNPSPQLHQ
jgi:hypothetical protein